MPNKQRQVRHPGVAMPNVVERFASHIAPTWALNRLRARVTFDALSGFVGASHTRRSLNQWETTRGSADADLLPDLPTLRERSRDLVRNNPIASGAISGTVTSVVGTGLQAQSVIDSEYLEMSDDDAREWQKTADREFRLWAESTDCDLTRHQDFYGLQDLVFRSALENGDALTILPFVPRKGSAYDLRIQIIEADRLVNKDNAVDTPTLAGGVEMDQYGAPIAYHILRAHPGSYFASTGQQWDRLEAFGSKTGRRNVLHHFRRVRPQQSRGIPYLAPVIEIIKQLGRYSDAEVMAAVVSGLFTAFITTPGGVGINTSISGGIGEEVGAKPGDKDVKMGNGTIVDLAEGETVSTAAPGRPNVNFDPFFQSCVRQIGVALELPFEVLIKHFTASYTAARAAILEAWKFYRGRRAWLVQSFCDPVYEAWMEEAVAIGRLDAPGFFDDPAIRRAYLGCRWHGDAMPQVDPVKEVEAARGRIDIGISDRAQETAALTGGDWDTTHKEQVREADMRKADGLDQVVPALVPLTKPDPTQGGDLETQPATPPAAPGGR